MGFLNSLVNGLSGNSQPTDELSSGTTITNQNELANAFGSMDAFGVAHLRGAFKGLQRLGFDATSYLGTIESGGLITEKPLSPIYTNNPILQGGSGVIASGVAKSPITRTLPLETTATSNKQQKAKGLFSGFTTKNWITIGSMVILGIKLIKKLKRRT